MKILITDDQARRYVRLMSALEAIGVQRNMVDIVPCSNDARERLSRDQYDLLILDILLPLWSEGEPDIQHSLDLLLELHEGNELHKPKHILGITGDKDIAIDASANFESQTWTVVEYSDSNDEWVHRAINCVRYILDEQKSADAQRPKHRVDLAIICALSTPELEEVLKLPWNWSAPKPIDDQTFVHDGYLEVEGRRITVCATSAPRMGMVATALRSANVITLLRPRLLAMCGICAGVRGKVEIGDVLLADPAWDFQSGKRVREKENSQFAISPHQLYSSTLVRSHIEQIRSDQVALAKIATDYGRDAPRPPRVVIGPVASGSAVLADGDVVNEIKTQHRDLIGIEMEVYGLYSAAYSASQPQPLPFAIKAVCDFADPSKGDNYQKYAAYTSANVLRLLMERFGLRLLNPP